MRWRWAWFWLLLAIGLVISVVSVYAGSRFGFLFLALPLIFPPFRLGKKSSDDALPALRRCSRCDFETFDPETRFCPRDGTLIEEPSAAPRAN